MNIIEEHIYINDLHYILEFDKPFFSFYLVNIPTRRQYIDYKKHPELILFRDDPIYEDIAINLPALKILRVMSKHIERLIYRYNINYWTFSATSMKKANVYEKLLQRWLSTTTLKFDYQRIDLAFYIYIKNK